MELEPYIKIITSSKYNAHTDPLFKQLNILKVSDLYKLSQLKFFYKLSNGKLPKYFDSFQLLRNNELHNYYTRMNTNYHRRRLTYHLEKTFLRNSLIDVLNSLPNNIIEKVHTHSYYGFSLYIKKIFF